MTKITGIQAKVDLNIKDGVANANKVEASDINEIVSVVNSNDTLLTNEVANRVSADNALQVNIDNEETSRENADTALQANIDLKADSTSLNLKADKTNVLEKDNTTAFTPTADYHPSTKKYVDDFQESKDLTPTLGSTKSVESNGVAVALDAEELARINADNNLQLGIDEKVSKLDYEEAIGLDVGTWRDKLLINNVNNTSDADKPISTDTQTALDNLEQDVNENIDLKLNISDAQDADFNINTSQWKTVLGVSNVSNTSDANKPISTATQTALDNKANINGSVTEIFKVSTAIDNSDAINKGQFDNAINAINSSLTIRGRWDADTNTPDISGITTTGYYWIVSVEGTTDLGGISDWKVNDWAVKTASGWAKIDNTDKVSSVAGKTGVVTLDLDDVSDSATRKALTTGAQTFTGIKTFNDEIWLEEVKIKPFVGNTSVIRLYEQDLVTDRGYFGVNFAGTGLGSKGLWLMSGSYGFYVNADDNKIYYKYNNITNYEIYHQNNLTKSVIDALGINATTLLGLTPTQIRDLVTKTYVDALGINATELNGETKEDIISNVNATTLNQVSAQSLSFAESYIQNYRSRLLDEGYTYFPNSSAYRFARLKELNVQNDASIVISASGVKESLLPVIKGLPLDFTRAGEARYFDENGVMQTALTNVPRVTFDENGDESILVEPTSTNLFTYSEDFTNTIYIKDTGISVTSNQLKAPDNTLTADLISVTNNNRIYSNNSSGTYVLSFFIKAGTFYNFKVRDSEIDLITKTNSNGTIEKFANGWFRIGCNYTGTRSFQIQAYPNNSYETHTISGSYYLWGSQLETYLTSYMPSLLGVSGTRNIGTVIKTGYEDYINSTEGTLFFKAKALGSIIASDRFIKLDDGTSDNVVRIGFGSATNSIIGSVVKATVSQCSFSNTDYTVTDYNKVAIVYKPNYFALFINGAKIVEDLSGDTFTASTLNRLVIDAGFILQDEQHYQTALTDEKVINLTTL